LVYSDTISAEDLAEAAASATEGMVTQSDFDAAAAEAWFKPMTDGGISFDRYFDINWDSGWTFINRRMRLVMGYQRGLGSLRIWWIWKECCSVIPW
jgi:hypothetical protein